MIVEPAPAKLNLALHVRGRRADGYHELETLFAFVEDGDLLQVERAAHWSLTITGPFATALSAADDNLVSQAARAFAAAYGDEPGLSVTLAKNLPVASGIGGGSADAAAMLRALARLGGVPLTDPPLVACAERLGADVPACLLGRTAVGRGRGEALAPVAGLCGTPVLLVNPGVAVATGPVFAAWDGIDRGPLPAADAATIARNGRNDLAAPAIALAPAIADVLALLEAQAGAETVRMSGSGATCFALFPNAASRDQADAAIAIAQPGWWRLPTRLA